MRKFFRKVETRISSGRFPMGAAESSRRNAPTRSSHRTSSSHAADARPQVRCWQCNDLFHSNLAGMLAHHVRCPYCSTINGVPASPAANAAASLAAAIGAATNRNNDNNNNNNTQANQVQQGPLQHINMERHEQLLRRLQTRDVSPFELLILRDFVEHLQHMRNDGNAGASASDIDRLSAQWVVDDVSKLPDELRTCCVCLEEVRKHQTVRTLPCLHTFHSECVEEWLSKKKVCPLCQFDIHQASQGEDSLHS